jgi:hypothetical protein
LNQPQANKDKNKKSLAHHVWQPGHMKVMSVQCGGVVPGDAKA